MAHANLTGPHNNCQRMWYGLAVDGDMAGPSKRKYAAAGIIVLLIVLLLMNATAIYIRSKTERRLK